MPLTGPWRKSKKKLKNILKKGLRFPKHRAIIHFAADTRELMRRCRTTASTSAFQAEDVGSTPITCSTKQARGKSSGLLAATTAYADVAELADALDSGSSGSDTVGVQVPSSAPKSRMRKHSGFFLFVSQSPGRSTGAFSFVCGWFYPGKNRTGAQRPSPERALFQSFLFGSSRLECSEAAMHSKKAQDK